MAQYSLVMNPAARAAAARYEKSKGLRAPATVPERTFGSGRPIQAKVVRAMADQQRAFAAVFDSLNKLREALLETTPTKMLP